LKALKANCAITNLAQNSEDALFFPYLIKNPGLRSCTLILQQWLTIIPLWHRVQHEPTWNSTQTKHITEDSSKTH